jgi:predicted nucleotidyltransferase
LLKSPEVLDNLVRRIAERFFPDKIILFGSSAQADAGPDSDIDLLVLFSEVADPNKRASRSRLHLTDVGGREYHRGLRHWCSRS